MQYSRDTEAQRKREFGMPPQSMETHSSTVVFPRGITPLVHIKHVVAALKLLRPIVQHEPVLADNLYFCHLPAAFETAASKKSAFCTFDLMLSPF